MLVVETSCLEVWRDISNYIDNNIDPDLRARLERHFKACKHRTAILEGTANTVRLIGDGKAFELPTALSQRPQQNHGRSEEVKK